MKWCRVEAVGRPSYAVVEGTEVELLDAAPFANLRRTGKRHRLDEVKFLPPVIPANFYAAGLNYRHHVEWAKQYHGMTNLRIPEQADVGYRSPSALIGSGADIVIPSDSPGPVEYEGELVAIIGKRAKHLSEDKALSCVAGYTLGNDLSERAWQRTDRTLWRSKNVDSFKPMGPVVVDGIDPMAQTIRVQINGRTVSEYSTSAMLFSVAHWISTISRYTTLYPGDVLWLGCDGVTIPPLKPGDLVEVVNEEIGVLANRVVRETEEKEKLA
jgi:2-keto-4-pentenoate hydratase/2-oxohepta-3-ene-1,7-dioic acid hydratase in catechol pathway